ncbi:hypothetical protein CBR_g46900 [Chara braunii]|uniref:Uncharacterized protein n=1 Tax=Chara braunii TaxID=69332 RepID=A0A388M186_CHABU|nr:hypothetical protein CBR_g46900 [Chara braunii]|eukprot:GBG88334.1 hypothetical protein CBR_g46900 [Chara braunii]
MQHYYGKQIETACEIWERFTKLGSSHAASSHPHLPDFSPFFAGSLVSYASAGLLPVLCTQAVGRGAVQRQEACGELASSSAFVGGRIDKARLK